MDISTQDNLGDLTDLSFKEKNLSESEASLDACKTLICPSIRGSVANNCPIKDCYFCAGVATIDDEISSTYLRLLDLVQKREQAIKKPHHDTFIHRVPVEILSLIFVFVKEAYDDPEDPWYQQPTTSPPLLVGAICKKWRDITLQTPQLWTDIKVDLGKPTDAQVDMVNEWGCRSGALPVNLQVSLSEGKSHREYETNISLAQEHKDIAQVLRSLAIRWNDVILYVPWRFCHNLFDDLEESPPISSFNIVLLDDTIVLDQLKLRHPIRPKVFSSWNVSGTNLPFEWDNLVHLEIGNIRDGQQLLHILIQAQNLRHWDVESDHYMAGAGLPTTTTYITNRSLIYFKTNIDIIGHLILPSLQHLHYSIGHSPFSSHEHLNSLSHFINRSHPPLQTFFLNYHIHPEDSDFCFKNLPDVTSLYITDHSRTDGPVKINYLFDALTKSSADSEVILPRLEEISFSLARMTPSSWSLFSRLFQKDIQLDPSGSKDIKAATAFGRPLSKVYMGVSNDGGMDKDTFLHLLAVRKLGVNVRLRGGHVGDLFLKMAEIYDVQLEETDGSD